MQIAHKSYAVLSAYCNVFQNRILAQVYFARNVCCRTANFAEPDRKRITGIVINPNSMHQNAAANSPDQNSEKHRPLRKLRDNRQKDSNILDFSSTGHAYTYNPFLHITHTDTIQILPGAILNCYIGSSPGLIHGFIKTDPDSIPAFPERVIAQIKTMGYVLSAPSYREGRIGA